MRRLIVMLVVLCLASVACGSHAKPTDPTGPSGSNGSIDPGNVDPTDPPDGGDGGGDVLPTIDPNASLVESTSIEVQLDKAFPDALDAGFLAATDQDLSSDGLSFYDREHLDVLVDPVPLGHDGIALASTPTGPEFFIGPEIAVLIARERGADLVNIAQLVQRSGERIVAPASSGITALADLKGKRLSVLDGGRDADVLIALHSAGLDPKHDVKLDHEPFDVDLFAAGTTAASQVTIQDEYARILESLSPDTDTEYTPTDLAVIDLSTPALATVQNGIYARASWLAIPGNADVAVAFLRATFRGWAYCRDHADECAQIALDSGADEPLQHQRWELNETNAQIWPSPNGIGALDAAAWAATSQAALDAGLLSALPAVDAARTDLAAQALATLTDIDTVGDGFQKATVPITLGGEDPDQ